MAQRCGTCRWLRVPPGRKRLANTVFPCDAPLPPFPALPEAMMRRLPSDMCTGTWPDVSPWIAVDAGENCPAWQRIARPNRSTAP